MTGDIICPRLIIGTPLMSLCPTSRLDLDYLIEDDLVPLTCVVCRVSGVFFKKSVLYTIVSCTLCYLFIYPFFL